MTHCSLQHRLTQRRSPKRTTAHLLFKTTSTLTGTHQSIAWLKKHILCLEWLLTSSLSPVACGWQWSTVFTVAANFPFIARSLWMTMINCVYSGCWLPVYRPWLVDDNDQLCLQWLLASSLSSVACGWQWSTVFTVAANFPFIARGLWMTMINFCAIQKTLPGISFCDKLWMRSKFVSKPPPDFTVSFTATEQYYR
jgi:hypothetical protein